MRPKPPIRIRSLAVVLTAASFAATVSVDDSASSVAATAAIAESTSAILQGDSMRAVSALAAVPAAEFHGKDAGYRACMLERHRAAAPELAQAREVSAKRLGHMITAESDDMDSPHTYANKRVIADLTARLGRSPDQVDIDTLQRAAREQLLADTQRRRAGVR